MVQSKIGINFVATNHNRTGGNRINSAHLDMTQIISHNANNQLFATRKEAMTEIVRNKYSVAFAEERTTLPCSFDERQRNRFDLNRDDEMAINVFVIETEEDEPMLIGYLKKEIHPLHCGQLISHNPKNKLFKTYQEASDEMARNGYELQDFMTTYPCSFSEEECSRFNLDYTFEEIKVITIYDGYGVDPILLGYIDGVITIEEDKEDIEAREWMENWLNSLEK